MKQFLCLQFCSNIHVITIINIGMPTYEYRQWTTRQIANNLKPYHIDNGNIVGVEIDI